MIKFFIVSIFYLFFLFYPSPCRELPLQGERVLNDFHRNFKVSDFLL